MERFPSIIVAGGMLLGWIAGGMLVTDPLFVNPTSGLGCPSWAQRETKMAVFNSPCPVLDRPHRRRTAGAGHRQDGCLAGGTA
jgi:hypothetical protein